MPDTTVPAAAFHRPATLDDALRRLAEGRCRVLAGGTDVYPGLADRPVASLAEPLLHVAALPALRELCATADGGWFVGAGVTWSRLHREPALPAWFGALRQAAREVGGVQVQNAGTVGGNVCNASPAADGVPALLALGAVAVVASRARGERRLPLHAFVTGPRRTALAPDELLLGFELPAHGPRARSAFAKLGGRRYLVISIAMAAVLLDVDASGRIVRAGVAVGSCSPVARRLATLEDRLPGMPAAEAPAAVRDDDLAAVLAPIDDVRASAAYRLEAAAVLLRRALAAAARDALEGPA